MNNQTEIARSCINNNIVDIYQMSIKFGKQEKAKYFANKTHIFPLPKTNKKILNYIIKTLSYIVIEDKYAPLYTNELIHSLFRFINSLSLKTKSKTSLFLDKICQINTPYKRYETPIIRIIFRIYNQDLFNNDIYSAKVWDLEEMNVSPERFNNTAKVKNIDFRYIKNKENEKIIKEYIYYLIYHSDIGTASICTAYLKICNVLNYSNKPYNEWSKTDAKLVFTNITLTHKHKAAYKYFSYFKRFTEYLLSKDIIKINPLIPLYETYKPVTKKYNYKSTAPTDYIVNQIFSILDKIIPEIALFFLIVKCTGARVSDVCQTKFNCLEIKKDENGNNIYSVYLYSTKMKKDLNYIIPENLYKLILKWQNENYDGSPFLFHSKKNINKCMQASYFERKMKNEINKFNIKNPDGTKYNFTAHSFRHLMAVDMKNHNIPIAIIQEQLHHSTPNMTMAYLEYTKDNILKEAKNFYDINGNKTQLDITVKLNKEDKYALYVKDFINQRMLINGICNKSMRLSECGHANSCIECKNFVTNELFLPSLSKELEETKKAYELAKNNNWLPQIKTYEKDIKRLESIINNINRKAKENDNSSESIQI